MNQADFACFHSPYNKLVQKSYGRLLFNDFRRSPDSPEFASVQAYRDVSLEETYDSREIHKAFLGLSKMSYQEKVVPTTKLPVELGNIYTASLYSCLASLIDSQGPSLVSNAIETSSLYTR